MRFLVLGARGMAGHLISLYLKESGEDIEGMARRPLQSIPTHVLDASNFDALKELIENGNYDVVINCIGVLNAAADNNISNAILMNSYLPHFLADVTRDMKTRIFHMSTDCVFSGRKGNYTENDFPDGETYYDRTKALGELNDNKNLTFRNSIVGPDINQNGIGLLNWFMKQENSINGYAKSIWTGVTTLTLAKAMQKAAYEGLTGLYNLVNNESISKYELLLLFNKYSGKNLQIDRVDGIDLNKSLICERKDFKFSVPSYEEQVQDMFIWMNNHRDLYSHYFKEMK